MHRRPAEPDGFGYGGGKRFARAAGRFLFRNVICDMAKAGYALKPPLKAAKTLIVHSSRCTNLQSEKTIGKTRATVAGVFPIFLFLI